MSKRKKKDTPTEAPVAEPESSPLGGDEVTPAGVSDAFSEEDDTVVTASPIPEEAVAQPTAPMPDEDWEGPTRESAAPELAELAAKSVHAPDTTGHVEGEPVSPEAEASAEAEAAPAADTEAPGEGEGEGAVSDEAEAAPPVEALAPAGRLESVLESLLFASDKALTLTEIKRLVGERDGGKLTAALESLRARRADTGIIVVSVAGGWHLRTNPENIAWVSRLVAGKPQRLSRAMLETLAIVAYRQPITRPEIDDIRGVDCGPVLKTLLDRNLVRMIGKKEEAGRPILYGTTPEFLRTLSLSDLSELPTLREFHELGAEEAQKVAAVDAERGEPAPTAIPRPTPLAAEPSEDDDLLSELEEATAAAASAAEAANPTEPAPSDAPPTEPA